MGPLALYILAFATGYFIGAIPIGLIVVRLMTGKDIRTVGSGRTGGTNALRAAGRSAFFITAFGDGFKGLIPVLLVRWLFPDLPLAHAVAGLGAMGGTIWSIYIGFKGGAGGATNLGVTMGLNPLVALVAIALAVLAFVTVRIAAVATMTGSATAMIALVVLAWLGQAPWEYLVYGIVQFVFVIITLRPNIERMMRGEERRVTFKRS